MAFLPSISEELVLTLPKSGGLERIMLRVILIINRVWILPWQLCQDSHPNTSTNLASTEHRVKLYLFYVISL